MAVINLSLSTKIDKITGKSQLLMQFVGGVGRVYRVKTGIYIEPARWKNGRIVIPRIAGSEQRQCAAVQAQLDKLSNLIIEEFAATSREQISKEWLTALIEGFHNPDRKAIADVDFLSLFERYIAQKRLSKIRVSAWNVIVRALHRFELYRNAPLKLDAFTADVVREAEDFLITEHTLITSRPEIYSSIPLRHLPTPRGRNTINKILKNIRAFIIWANKQGFTTTNAFNSYRIPADVYGTPYYITIAERNRIASCNLSRHPKLATQRDIFVFHCLVGCRVSDLIKLTHKNIVDGAIEYVPRKTIGERPVTVRVPLNSLAREIVERYKDSGGEELLPFISEQKYNYAIKRIFLAAGLVRLVTIIDPKTGEQQQRRLCDIASSHLARRTFVGNLYKQVKDPNLVGALSGHTEGSKAFARYRDIDEDMKKELVKLLE